MFYSVFVLGKKGPLAKVWLAAHWDKKITKSQILETNIVESVDSILQPRIKLSLRTSSHLLLGIVRIYARKTIYLLQDCQDAAFKIKSAFRPGAVDLPEGRQEAAFNAITLPEIVDFVANFDFIEPPSMIDPVVNTTNHKNITLPEDVASTISSGYQPWANNGEMSSRAMDATNVSGASALKQYDQSVVDDGFGGGMGIAAMPDEEFFQVDMDADGAPKGEDLPSQTQQPDRPISRSSSVMSAANSPAPSTPGGAGFDMDNVQGPFDDGGMDVVDENAPPTNGDSRLPTIQEEAPIPDSMVLDPVIQDGLAPRRKRRRRLGIIVDEVKTLSGEEIKAQLSDTKDIVTAIDLAPPSKQLMEVRRCAVDKLFEQPQCKLLSKVLADHYSRNLISSKLDHDAAETELPVNDSMDIGKFADGDSHNFNGHFMNDHPSYEHDSTGVQQDISYIDNQGGDYLPPRTPKTPAAYRSQSQSQTRSPPKKKRASDQKSTKKSNEADSFNESFNNNNVTAEEEDEAVDDPMNVGETEEQYEERIRNRRTHILLQLLAPRLDEGTIQFSHLCNNYRRKQVAQHFFSLLVLKKQQAIDLVQEETGNSYGELYVSKGPRYEQAIPSN